MRLMVYHSFCTSEIPGYGWQMLNPMILSLAWPMADVVNMLQNSLLLSFRILLNTLLQASAN